MSEHDGNTLQLVDSYQTAANAGTYDVSVWLSELEDPSEELKEATLDVAIPESDPVKLKLHVAGPRFFLPPSDIHSVFPPENGEGDYNNILPHVVLNRRTLPWERRVDGKSEEIPFLALLIFTEDEEASGKVTPDTLSLKDLTNALEPGELPTDKVIVIDVQPDLLKQIIPTGKDLCLLAHGREIQQGDLRHQRAVVIANRLPTPPSTSQTNKSPTNQSQTNKKRHIAHLVMLENRYSSQDDLDDNKPSAIKFDFGNSNPSSVSARSPVRLVSLKSWQFTCSADKPTLDERLRKNGFTFNTLQVPAPVSKPVIASENNNTVKSNPLETIRSMGYTALPYYLRSGNRVPTLYHGPLVAGFKEQETLEAETPVSAEGLVRLLKNHRIFDVSLAAAWQLGQLLMLQDQTVAMAYFNWRRLDAQRQAKQQNWERNKHLQWEDSLPTTGPPPFPGAVLTWFQEKLSLRGIPFEYWVPDSRMLPENSLRVFQIHPDWIAAFINGAIAIGRSGEAAIRREAAYRQHIMNNLNIPKTGFLLRSPAVDEHPDLLTEAFSARNQLLEDPVRLENIGKGLLLGLYDGNLSTLQFSLPPIGLHFGFREDGDRFVKDHRNEVSSEIVEAASAAKEKMINPVEVTLQENRTLDMDTLRDNMADNLNIEEAADLPPYRFAFQMFEGIEMVEFKMHIA